MTDLLIYGPAFSSLTEKRKRFVLAMASNPFGSHAEWARAAGYSDASGGDRVRGCELMQDADVREAALEVARGNFGTVGPLLATTVLLEIAGDRKHKDQMRAAELIANRVGLHETQEIHVTHELTGDALMARLTQVAERLGLDPQKLIGGNVGEGKPPVVIEGEVIDPAPESAG